MEVPRPSRPDNMLVITRPLGIQVRSFCEPGLRRGWMGSDCDDNGTEGVVTGIVCVGELVDLQRFLRLKTNDICVGEDSNVMMLDTSDARW